MNYERKPMSGDQAKKALQDILCRMQGIDKDDLTENEVWIIQSYAKKCPKFNRDKNRKNSERLAYGEC